MSWADDVKWGPWIIPADGMSRFRYTADRREMDVQHREIVQCNGCRQRAGICGCRESSRSSIDSI